MYGYVLRAACYVFVYVLSFTSTFTFTNDVLRLDCTFTCDAVRLRVRLRVAFTVRAARLRIKLTCCVLRFRFTFTFACYDSVPLHVLRLDSTSYMLGSLRVTLHVLCFTCYVNRGAFYDYMYVCVLPTRSRLL